MKTEQRVIKFRVWDFKQNRMLNHDWLVAGDVVYHALFNPNRKDLSVMQFTGLVDKEGNDVYEGDFFLIDGVALIVIFEDGKYCFDNTGGSYGRDFLGQDRVGRLTRSGNIYQHPHLLPSTTTI